MIRIEVIDREGWHKEFMVEKTFTYIGCDSRSDIILNPGRGGGVLSPHAQIIVSTQTGECKLVNLANTELAMGPNAGEIVRPLSAVPLSEGSIFRLGEFTLVFRGGEIISALSPTRAGKNIGLTVSMLAARLEPHRALEGSIRVSNLGASRGAAQIELELLGLDPYCYDIEPGPVLFPHAEKEVFFHIYHRGSKPLAGDCQLTFRATAPRVYPDEEVTVTRTIKIAPVYLHEIKWESPTRDARQPEPVFIPTRPLQATPATPITHIEPPPRPETASELPIQVGGSDDTRPEISPAATLPEEYVSPPTVRRIRAPRQSRDQKLPEETLPGDEGEWTAPTSGSVAQSNNLAQTAGEPSAEELPARPVVEQPVIPPPAMDWETTPARQDSTRPVIHLKAKPATPKEQENLAPPSTEDWWKPG